MSTSDDFNPSARQIGDRQADTRFGRIDAATWMRRIPRSPRQGSRPDGSIKSSLTERGPPVTRLSVNPANRLTNGRAPLADRGCRAPRLGRARSGMSEPSAHLKVILRSQSRRCADSTATLPRQGQAALLRASIQALHLDQSILTDLVAFCPAGTRSISQANPGDSPRPTRDGRPRSGPHRPPAPVTILWSPGTNAAYAKGSVCRIAGSTSGGGWAGVNWHGERPECLELAWTGNAA